MADEFQTGICSGNWWDSSRNRYESASSPASTVLTSVGSYAWQPDMVDIKATRSASMDSVSVSGATSVVFPDTQKMQGPDSSSGGGGGGGVLADPNLQMMGLGLSSQAMDWNQALLRSGKAESSFGSMLQDQDMSSNSNFNADQAQWRQKLFSGSCEDSSGTEYKQVNRGFSLDQPQFSSHSSPGESTVTCQGLPTSFQVDSSVYGSPSTILQGLLGSDHQQNQSSFENRPMNYPYLGTYGVNSNEFLPSWSKVPQFLRTSPPKQPSHTQLHFSNNAPFWNASAAAMAADSRPSFSPTLQPQFSTPTFNEKPKNSSEIRDISSVAKKSSGETGTKRPRSETPSPLPAFKVRKEKMGDRITALQQLVSPFGKTDTASVLSEAIEYIKFLHEQVSALSTPYMKSGASIQHQQNSEKSKEPEGPRQDLRSRGLCLVPVSSTFPVTHETSVDFWTPTFGGTFR